MKGRALHLGFVASFMGMAITASALAADDTDVPPGWIVSEGSSSCTASFELADADSEKRSASVEITRSYRKEAERPVRLRLPLDYDVGPSGVISATLHLEGEEAVLGNGFVTDNATLSGSVGSFTLNAEGIAQLGAGSKTSITLVVMSAGLELETYEAALPATDQVTFDACFDRVGAKLTADDREPGAKPRAYPKPPVPKGNPGRWITVKDYPARALRDEEEGISTVRLSISRFGFPTKCEVIATSGSTLLDQTACKRMLQRAEFFPARDLAYVAMEGTYSQSISWMIPE